MREEDERKAVLLKEGHAIYLDYVQRGKQAKTEQEVIPYLKKGSVNFNFFC